MVRKKQTKEDIIKDIKKFKRATASKKSLMNRSRNQLMHIRAGLKSGGTPNMATRAGKRGVKKSTNRGKKARPNKGRSSTGTKAQFISGQMRKGRSRKQAEATWKMIRAKGGRKKSSGKKRSGKKGGHKKNSKARPPNFRRKSRSTHKKGDGVVPRTYVWRKGHTIKKGKSKGKRVSGQWVKKPRRHK